MQVAAELGRTPSQVAINWVRQQSPNIIPMLGARRLAQIAGQPGRAGLQLSAEHLARYRPSIPWSLAIQHSFWNDFVRRDLVFGERCGRTAEHFSDMSA